MFKLALGAGHGLRTAGKRCLKSLDRNETREWWLNDRVCDYIQDKLSDYDGVSVLRMDDSDDGADDVAVADRAKAANAWNADLYLSIHHNAGMNGGSDVLDGVKQQNRRAVGSEAHKRHTGFVGN